MTTTTPVERYLNDKGIDYELILHRTTGSTHESAVAADVADDHIAKAVVVRDEQGVALAVIPGDAWIDLDALNRESGRDFYLDDEADLANLFPDCVAGAVPAIGPAYGLETFMDDSLKTLANLYFEAGDHRHLARISGDDLVRMLPGVRHGRFSRQG